VFVRTLRSHGLTGSMGRAGACGDNAAMESVFALLQKNVLDRQRWSTREQLRLAIITWIERTYHRRRAPATARPPHTHRRRDNQPGRIRSQNHPVPESTKAGAVPDSAGHRT
jgi:transposase InsO family protein